MSTRRIDLLALAFTLSFLALVSAVARADEARAPQTPTPGEDYQNKINPATNIGTTGPYDWEDLYRDAHGFALPGYAQIR